MQHLQTFSNQEQSDSLKQEHQKDQKKIQTEEHISESDEIDESSFLYQNLKQSLDRLKAFIQMLGESKDRSISSTVRDQFDIDEGIYKNMKSQIILDEAEKRIQKMIRTHKLKKNWSTSDLRILIWVAARICEKDGLDAARLHDSPQSWVVISSLIPGTTKQSCLFKWLSLKRYKITQYTWSQSQEKDLIALQKKYQKSKNKWKFISEQLYLLNQDPHKIYRHPKQCREHYTSFLDPQIKKGAWTKQEDFELLKHILENEGQKKWCRLVKILNGRTENAIKNRYQLIFLKLKKKKQNKSKSQLQLIEGYIRENEQLNKPNQNLRVPAEKIQKVDCGTSTCEISQEKQLIQPKQSFSKPIIPIFNHYTTRVPYHSNFQLNLSALNYKSFQQLFNPISYQRQQVGLNQKKNSQA